MNILYGKLPAELVLNQVKDFVKGSTILPSFAIIKIGNNKASDLYIEFKQKKAKEVGINSQLFYFKESISFSSLKIVVEQLNADSAVHGIIIQMPLPNHLKNIIQLIDPMKDIDGLTSVQQGNLLLNRQGLFPCTALGVIKLLKYYRIELSSKKVAIIGRSNLVGKPLSLMFLDEDSLITIFHSKIDFNLFKKELPFFDIICSAVGEKHFIKPEFIKNDSVLIDIGVTKDGSGTFGDIDPTCYTKSLAYTPSIGGIGPMTIACLLDNIIKAFKYQIYS